MFVGTGIGSIVGEGRSVRGIGVSVGIAVDIATKTLVGSMREVSSALGVHAARDMTDSIIAVAAKTRENTGLPAVRSRETSKPTRDGVDRLMKIIFCPEPGFPIQLRSAGAGLRLLRSKIEQSEPVIRLAKYC